MEINGIYSSPFFLDISTAENEDFTTRLFELILILEKENVYSISQMLSLALKKCN